MGVHVGPGVLGLALLQQYVGHDLVELCHKLEHGIIGQVFEGKLALARVPRIRLPQHCVPVPWYHLAQREEIPIRDSSSMPYMGDRREDTSLNVSVNLPNITKPFYILTFIKGLNSLHHSIS